MLNLRSMSKMCKFEKFMNIIFVREKCLDRIIQAESFNICAEQIQLIKLN